MTVPAEVPCPRCDQGPHPFQLVAVLGRGTLLFGGGSGTTALLATANLVCPVSGEPYDASIRVPAENGERIQSVRVIEPAPSAESGPTPEAAASSPGSDQGDWRPAILADLRRTSLSQARDSAAKLLAAGTAAISAYFTVLKFVAGDSANGWRLAVAVLPAAGYAAVTVLAAMAARPVLMRVYDDDDFAQQREQLLTRLDRLLQTAVGVFAAATVLTVVAYVVVWP